MGPNRGEHSAELGYVNGPESKMLMQEESLALSQPYRAFSRRDNGGGVCQGQGGGLAHSTTIEHNHAGNVADNSGGRLSRKMIHLREDPCRFRNHTAHSPCVGLVVVASQEEQITQAVRMGQSGLEYGHVVAWSADGGGEMVLAGAEALRGVLCLQSTA